MGQQVDRTLIAPSLLACDLTRIATEVESAAAAGADLLHFDVMDGVFVPNLTFGPGLCTAVRKLTTLPLDVHLMVINPESYLESFVKAGANRISLHVEATAHLHRHLTRIRELGAEAGVAINPATSLSTVEEAWPFMDFLLIMTVNPGFGGQHLIPETIEKIERARQQRDARGHRTQIVIDGGVDASNAERIRKAGADILVAGTAVFGQTDRTRAIRCLRGEVQ